MKKITRGELAKLSEIGIETVRFYEQKGLLPKPNRSEAGYRLYKTEDVNRIRFVKRAQELGFSLREIRDVLELNQGSGTKCADIKRKTDTKLLEIESKISDLRKMQRTLKELSSACGDSKRAASECNILECFEKPNWKC